MLNKNDVKGVVDQATGKAKQAVGAVTGSEKLKAEGRVDEAVGKVESAVGHATRKVGEAVAAAGNAVKR